MIKIIDNHLYNSTLIVRLVMLNTLEIVVITKCSVFYVISCGSGNDAIASGFSVSGSTVSSSHPELIHECLSLVITDTVVETLFTAKIF